MTRLALAIASYGATEAGGALLDAVTKQTSKELDKAAANFWARESGTRIAMQQFREALMALTAPIEEDQKPKKLVIVIDELDRCRPDYALSLLEIIKHFFDVPHVHFVLGANMRELQNSVSARYGTGIDARLYLQKFVTLTMTLLADEPDGSMKSLIYMEKNSRLMAINGKTIETTSWVLSCYKEMKKVSLRDIDRLLSLLALFPEKPRSLHEEFGAIRVVVLTLALMKVRHPDEYRQFVDREFKLNTISGLFHFRQNVKDSESNLPRLMREAWLVFLDPASEDKKGNWGDFKPQFPMHAPQDRLNKLIDQYLETFSIYAKP